MGLKDLAEEQRRRVLAEVPLFASLEEPELSRLLSLGQLVRVDRRQDIIITGGYNVYAIEVENCLNSHPAVQNSAVVGIPHETWGEQVCAMVILARGCRASAQELIDHCKDHLARYKAPGKIEMTDQLPLSPAGKVLRR